MVQVPEYWEYRKRKSEAQMELILGFIGLGIGLWGIWNAHGEFDQVIYFIFLIAGIYFIWDGNTKLEKIKYIMWTREALREHDARKKDDKNIENSVEGHEDKPILKIIPEDGAQEIDDYLYLLELLDKKFIMGDVSEATYNELKIKYQSQINKLKNLNER